MVEEGDPEGLMDANLCRQGERQLQERAENMIRLAARQAHTRQRLRGQVDSPFVEVGRANDLNWLAPQRGEDAIAMESQSN